MTPAVGVLHAACFVFRNRFVYCINQASNQVSNQVCNQVSNQVSNHRLSNAFANGDTGGEDASERHLYHLIKPHALFSIIPGCPYKSLAPHNLLDKNEAKEKEPKK